MNYHTFRTIIEPDENNTYHGWVPILPGCHTFGSSIEETKKNLKEAIELYVLSLQDDGEAIPQENGMESFETISTPKFVPTKRKLSYA
ncbi:MAG: type II toxin-antitoxin system HicB family antitoxin [Patescibacteria group bacterium]